MYNRPDHIKSYINSDDNYNNELLPYLTKKNTKHKDLKKFNDISLKDDSKWKKLKKFVFVNTITTIVRFDNLNHNECINTLLELKKIRNPDYVLIIKIY